MFKILLEWSTDHTDLHFTGLVSHIR